jgi:hypothetical protein
MYEVPQHGKEDGIGNDGSSWQGEVQRGPIPKFLLYLLIKEFVNICNIQGNAEWRPQELGQM